MNASEQYRHELQCERARVAALKELLEEMTAKHNREWDRVHDANKAAFDARMALAYEQAERRKVEAERDDALAKLEWWRKAEHNTAVARDEARAELAALKAERDEARRAPGHNQIKLHELREASERVRAERDRLRGEVERLKELARKMQAERDTALRDAERLHKLITGELNKREGLEAKVNRLTEERDRLRAEVERLKALAREMVGRPMAKSDAVDMVLNIRCTQCGAHISGGEVIMLDTNTNRNYCGKCAKSIDTPTAER